MPDFHGGAGRGRGMGIVTTKLRCVGDRRVKNPHSFPLAHTSALNRPALCKRIREKVSAFSFSYIMHGEKGGEIKRKWLSKLLTGYWAVRLL